MDPLWGPCRNRSRVHTPDDIYNIYILEIRNKRNGKPGVKEEYEQEEEDTDKHYGV